MRDTPWLASTGATMALAYSPAADRWPHAAPLPRPLLTTRGCAAVFVATDLAALLISVEIAAVARLALWGPLALPLGLMEVGAVWVVLRLFSGLYPGYGLSPVEELQRSLTTTGVAALAHAAALFGLQAADVSRFGVLVTWAVLAGASWTLRGAAKTLLIRLGRFGTPVVVAGAGDSGTRFVDTLRANPGLGLVPVAFFDDDPAKDGRVIRGVPVLGPIGEAAGARFPYPVRHAVIAIPSLGGQQMAQVARGLSARYLHVGVMRDLFGLADLSLRPRALGDCMALEIRNNLLDPVNVRFKRLFDLAVAAPLALAALPVVLAAAAVVKLVSPGPALFVQEREGRCGRRIRVWKIRTMVPDAEALLAKHLAENAEARAEWARYVKLRHDPRVIPIVGRFLRRSSLDELPQLWNVLRGEMSLVGPRPFTEYHLVNFPEEFRTLRRQALPGMTGLWQVTCRSDGDLRAQEQMDTYYIRNWSLWIDLWVLLRTARAVLGGRGAR